MINTVEQLKNNFINIEISHWELNLLLNAVLVHATQINSAFVQQNYEEEEREATEKILEGIADRLPDGVEFTELDFKKLFDKIVRITDSALI